ncbi:MAG: 30S ribosomal protein S7 [Parcubacteria group bacterium]|nr:30S ribosomal protein S7 [Parcubacteria group bacterium]
MRRARAKKKAINPDPKYASVLLGRFINVVMKQGKKSVAQTIVYDALARISQKLQADPIEVFDQAIRNVTPILEVRPRRIGGANYQIPIEVVGDRKYALAFRWILTAAATRKGAPMGERLALELLDAYHRTGAAIKKREDVHKMAEANRAFAHFARF